jgi:hypothetical protein
MASSHVEGRATPGREQWLQINFGASPIDSQCRLGSLTAPAAHYARKPAGGREPRRAAGAR